MKTERKATPQLTSKNPASETSAMATTEKKTLQLADIGNVATLLNVLLRDAIWNTIADNMETIENMLGTHCATGVVNRFNKKKRCVVRPDVWGVDRGDFESAADVCTRYVGASWDLLRLECLEHWNEFQDAVSEESPTFLRCAFAESVDACRKRFMLEFTANKTRLKRALADQIKSWLAALPEESADDTLFEGVAWEINCI